VPLTKEKVTLSDGKVVEIREPLVRDIRAVKDFKDNEEKEIRLVGNLTNLTIEELDALTLKDYGKLQEVLQSFLS
jgi:predicted DNA-binding protein (UPF0251 family)